MNEKIELCWVGEGNVWKMPVVDDKTSSKSFIAIPSNPSDLDAIIIDPVNKYIYLVDVVHEINDQQKGRLYRYSETGEPIDDQETDVRLTCLVFDTFSSCDGGK